MSEFEPKIYPAKRERSINPRRSHIEIVNERLAYNLGIIRGDFHDFQDINGPERSYQLAFAIWNMGEVLDMADEISAHVPEALRAFYSRTLESHEDLLANVQAEFIEAYEKNTGLPVPNKYTLPNIREKSA